MFDQSFEEIRPYYDHEIRPALKRISEQPQFASIAKYLYPDRPTEEFAAAIRQFDNIKEFQEKVMMGVFGSVIEKTTKGISTDGLQCLDRKRPYLFVSNHRDIVLDPAIHFYIMVLNGFSSGEIAFGDNLMLSPFLVDIAKVNKVLTVFRSGTMKEKLKNSKNLSAYLRYLITEKGESVWIAQRNGRTKDGIDKTDQGLLKMFHLSAKDKDIEESISELNIVPISISYEIEPCDSLKAIETWETTQGTFEKKPTDDFESILEGIKQQKGRMHLSYGKPISPSMLEGLEGEHKNDFFHKLALLIDQHIVCNFKLWPNNYMAFDLLHNSDRYLGIEYGGDDLESFTAYLHHKTKDHPKPDDVRKLMLSIYSNPLVNKQNC
jgi:hypothetical protein